MSDNILKEHELKELEKKHNRSFSKTFNSFGEIGDFVDRNNWFFENCCFNCDVEFWGEFGGEVNFSNAIFVEKADFRNSIFKRSRVLFINTIFLNQAYFEKVRFEKDKKEGDEDKIVRFKNSEFFGLTKFTDVDFAIPADFRKVEFSGPTFFDLTTKKEVGNINSWQVEFDDARFSKKAIFYRRKFGRTSFRNTTFEALADFFDCEFEMDTCFDKTDFLWTCDLAKTVFNKKAIFLYTQVERNMILRNAKFKGGVNFALINFIGEGHLNTLELVIDDFVPSLDVDSHDDEKFSSEISQRHKRETFRILKHESIKSNNRIEALKFHAQEMEAYREELRGKKKSKWLGLFRKLIRINFLCFYLFFDKLKKLRIEEKSILLLNRVSNKYGLSWGRGVLFTFFAGLFFFFIYVPVLTDRSLDLSMSGIAEWIKLVSEQLKYFPHVFNPTHPFDYMGSVSENYQGAALVVDMLGRIVVGFGIYQTIQAFRKYGRF